MSYAETKRKLHHARDLIDEGYYQTADKAIRHSGATRADLDNVLGSARLAKMRAWHRETADALRGKAD